ncbi:HrpF/NolX family T3SS translocon protein [Xanthomonas phaseoli]|uniref:Serine kinase n=1 Tax=Xanthomonas phaseoli pv. dieffenbachiae TaxID=92828 RepID=A0A1V9GZL7_9XANT|nr:HrpF/NolX family T3SS translocon protein [Xanthomonas phaseoli]MBO9789434.1 serine kinase [Xanthomonas phaseoli pv. dieffenbachiae]MBO9883969.1 serine kinase [Xanthomonas phaseoli pv. dieffenbachiae]MBO9914923.1 serine kinase [Xanthomonas phaseoli pv. dieffenbachiae]MBO9939924.1 serine kinase [Xanthomonas phaseoli pv. dieffenbachiae]MBO9993891.1 serine kinase [Xanthomonas phaseoli pv. dieffenbachiae]
MSLNTFSTGSNPSQLLGTPLNESDPSELFGSDASTDDSDLPSTMDDIFLMVYQLLAALQANTPTSASTTAPGDTPANTPSDATSTSSSASDDQANQPIEKRTSWPSLGYDFDPKDIKGKDAPPALEGSTVTWNGGTLTPSELQIVSTLNAHKDQMPLEYKNLDDKINDPSTPADLKAALQGLKQDPRLFFAIGSQGDGKCGGKIKAQDLWDFSDSHPQVKELGGKNDEFNPKNIKGSNPPPAAEGSTVTWNDGQLNQSELEIVSVLDRHKDQVDSLSFDQLDAKINDPSTQSDLKEALKGLQKDPRLFFAIGSQKDGKCGGKIKAKDLTDFSSHHPQIAEYNDKKAKDYTQNYIASDSPDKTKASVMTKSDALRELYRYSDYLPDNLSEDEFAKIVDGDSKTGKCPPQVIAAAQYFRDHPDEWKEFAGDSGSMSTPDFLQKSSSEIHLTADEQKTLDTINSHQDAFYGDGKEVTRDKLDAISKDDKADPAVKQAATQLLNDPLLFGLLNNSITGYKKPHHFFGGGHVVDSGKISQNDFRQFYDHMSAANKTVDTPATHEASSPDQQKAVADMLVGKDDPPAIKKPKKDVGTFQHGLHEFLKWDSKILDWMSVGLSALNGIPIIGEIADAASIALESEAQAAQVVDTAIQGGDMSLALKLAGINMAGAVVGAVGGPTARIGAKAIAKGVAEAATKEAGKSAAKATAKGTASGVAKGTGKTATQRQTAGEFLKGYAAGTSISKPVEILKTPVLAGLHYEEYKLDQQQNGQIHQNLEKSGGVPVGKQIIPTNIANNFEGDMRQNLRNIRIRRR